ncbi:MAG: SH3 domain-containing protein [Deltaproteobacteria bacterium]|nr:SH3 domain-containing protein [Deltaproteobacteria bacterium]
MYRRCLFPAVVLAAGLVGLFGSAEAVKRGGTLFIKARNTKLMATASPTANVVAVLQPGDAVTWRGSSTQNKRWHNIEYKGKTGVVFVSNLSPKKPHMELSSSKGGQVDSRAFASSGAASKALGEGAVAYGNTKNMGQAVAQIVALEKLAKRVAPAQVAAHVKRAGLFPVVGGSNE